MENDPLIGQLLDGKYEVQRLVGVGGMGKVYAGRNVRTESPVAIKTLIPELVKDATLVKRFEIEAKAASNLHHPNTIRIYDFGGGQDAGMLFMVMELLNGGSLESVLRKEGPQEPRRVLRIMKQVCRSLAEAHGMGLVHRDLKPDNIFLNRAGGEEDFVKVLDFGVAKLKDNRYGNATLTQAGMIFGTPTYMSPEQARAFDIDGRSDIYALGVILYECLTGKAPFEANDPVAVLIQHVQEPPPPFRVRSANTPNMPEFEALVMRCLKKKPDDRFQSVNELLAALEDVERIYGTGYTTGNQILGGANTLLMEQGGSLNNNVPDPTMVPRSGDWADRLGVDDSRGTVAGGAYALGGKNTQYGDGPAPEVVKSPMRVILGVLIGVVVIAAIGIAVLLSTPAPPTPEPVAADGTPATPADSEAPTEASAAEASAAGPSAAELELAQLRFANALIAATPKVASAVDAARAETDARTVQFQVVEANGVPAMLHLADAEGSMGSLPYTFTQLIDPIAEGSAAPTLALEVRAEGYVTEPLVVPLADAPAHTITLRRRSTGGTRPPRPDGPSGPLDNVYGP